MSRARQRAYVAEAIRRASLKSSWGPKLLYDPCQRNFAMDPSKFKVGLCSRRAGKTVADAWMAVDTAQRHPRRGVPYVTLTRTSEAAKFFWSELDRLNDEHRLGAHLDKIRLVMTLPNKASVFIAGADDERTVQRLRGGGAPGIIVDEAQGFGERLEKLVLGTLVPSLVDLNGWIAVTGTPGVVPAGFFWKASTGQVPGWSVHRWTIRDNPHIPHADAWLADFRKTMGWSEDHPDYVREWLGQWVDDPTSLVYRLPASGRLQEMPVADDWRYVLGIDVGYTDACAFTVLCWSHKLRMTVIVSSTSKAEMLPSDIYDHVLALSARYTFDRIVIDPGGGKGYGEELRQRFGLPVIVAKKRNKVAYISHMNSELRTGMLKVFMPGASGLVEEEWDLLPWNADRSDVDDRVVPDHRSDSALYGWRECMAWLPREAPPGPPTGPDRHLGPRPSPKTPEDMARFWEKRIDDLARAEQDPWGMDGYPDEPGDFPA